METYTHNLINNNNMDLHFQAALKIQRAWRSYWYRCPYCDTYGCKGYYSQFNCREMWSESELGKLDAQLDRLNSRW